MSIAISRIIEFYLRFDQKPKEIISMINTLGLRVARAALYAVTVYALLLNQNYYDLNLFILSLSIFGIALFNDMYGVLRVLIVFLLIIVFLPEKASLIQLFSQLF
ncbi:hypothetical protein [Microvirga sp. 17 mud 1-3]|uniref:hypothetical protein n=1 Tax=Microvirga sp. 17 mud 1-3 TaxID=2082949 RepID=UPI0013A54C47|nr:hypothetical protein [Microvirga sp. 17 mud 1-3]